MENNYRRTTILILSLPRVQFHFMEDFLSRHTVLILQYNLQSSVGKESACGAGDPSSIPGLGRSPGEGNGDPL